MKLLELIFPYKCPFCGKLISDKDANQNKCEECAIKLKKNKFEFCNNTYDFLPNNKALYCVYRYNGMLRDAVIRYKFKDEIWLAKPFARMLIEYIEQYCDFKLFDVIVCVPVSAKRLKNRGYDQSFEIAKFISREKKIPIVSCLLKVDAFGDNAAEHKDRNQRISESRYNFKGSATSINSKNVLLLDDVITTGSTIRDCTDILIENGAKSVYAAVLASGRRDI